MSNIRDIIIANIIMFSIIDYDIYFNIKNYTPSQLYFNVLIKWFLKLNLGVIIVSFERVGDGNLTFRFVGNHFISRLITILIFMIIIVYAYYVNNMLSLQLLLVVNYLV